MRAAVPELSGLVKSRRYADLFWAHSDSNNAAHLYAINGRGRTRARYQLRGATNVDWEDIAIDAAGRIYLGDIGNNFSDRDDLSIYVLREPDPRRENPRRDRTLAVERRIRFRYPDQWSAAGVRKDSMNFDAEAMFVSAQQLYILTKHWQDGFTTLYCVPLAAANAKVTLEKITTLDLRKRASQKSALVTAADVSPDGRFVALITYRDLFVYRVGGPRVLEARAGTERLPNKSALEALAWNGHTLLLGAEDGSLLRMVPPGVR